MYWILISLMSSMAWAVEAILDKVLVSKILRNEMVITVVWAIISSSILLILVFYRIAPMNLLVFGVALFAGVIGCLSAVPYYKALQLEEASRIIPVLHFSPVFTLVLSFFFLGERLNANQIGAFFLIFVSGFLLSIRDFKKWFTLNKAFMIMASVAFVSALKNILSKYVYMNAEFWDGFIIITLGNFFGGVILLFSRKNRNLIKMNAKLIRSREFIFVMAAMGALSIFSTTAFQYAIKLGPVSLVSVLGSVAPVFIFLLAVFLSKKYPRILKEEIDRKSITLKGISIALMIAGLILLNI